MWAPTNCAYRLQHLRSSRTNGGHAASCAGDSANGGGAAVSPADAINAYLGVETFASKELLPCEQRANGVTGFEIDAEVPTILKLKSGAQAWDHTGIKAAFDKMDRVPPSIPRKTRAKLFGMHGFNSLTPAKQASHGWFCTTCPGDAMALRYFGNAVTLSQRAATHAAEAAKKEQAGQAQRKEEAAAAAEAQAAAQKAAQEATQVAAEQQRAQLQAEVEQLKRQRDELAAKAAKPQEPNTQGRKRLRAAGFELPMQQAVHQRSNRQSAARREWAELPLVRTISLADRPPLGAGGCCEVFHATMVDFVKDKIKVAIKKVHSERVGEHRTRLIIDLVNEVRLLNNLRHPNVLRTYGIHESIGGEPGAVIELCSCCLSQCLKRLSDPEQDVVARGLARGLAYLHRKPVKGESKPVVVHGDFKPGNVLITAEGEPKISDFGLSIARSRSDEREPAYYGCTGHFRSPEAWVPEAKAGTAADMYAYACVLVCLANKTNNPYRGKNALKEVMRSQVPAGTLRPEIAQADHRWGAVVVACRVCDPQLRWSSARVVKYFEENAF